MFGFDPRSRDERAESDALHDYLDDLNAGVLAPGGEIDPNLATTVSQVHTSGRQPAAPYGLKSQIWEDLMSNTPSAAIAPGSVAAPHRRRSTNGRPFTRVTQPLGRISRSLPTLNFYAAAAFIALIAMLGGFGAYALRPGGGSPGTGGNSLPAAITQATPSAALDPKDAFAACYANPAPDVKEIFSIVNSAVFQTPYTTDRDPNATEPVRKPSFVGDLPAETPKGTEADAATTSAVTDAYISFRLCSTGGINLQVLSLFTPNGIARLFVPGGDAIDFGTLTPLLNPYGDTGPKPDMTQVDALTNEVEAVQLLDDGRVVVSIEPTDTNAAYSNYHYVILSKVGDQWLVDDLAWNPVG